MSHHLPVVTFIDAVGGFDNCPTKAQVPLLFMAEIELPYIIGQIIHKSVYCGNSHQDIVLGIKILLKYFKSLNKSTNTIIVQTFVFELSSGRCSTL